MFARISAGFKVTKPGSSKGFMGGKKGEHFAGLLLLLLQCGVWAKNYFPTASLSLQTHEMRRQRGKPFKTLLHSIKAICISTPICSRCLQVWIN